jgi:hypothetical protein
MMLHQDGSRHDWLAGRPMLDLVVTMDDATSTLYSAFLVEEEGTASSFRGLTETLCAKGLPSSLLTASRHGAAASTEQTRASAAFAQTNPNRKSGQMMCYQNRTT